VDATVSGQMRRQEPERDLVQYEMLTRLEPFARNNE